MINTSRENYKCNIDEHVVPNECLTQGMNRNEVNVTISRTKNEKSRGMDGIPVKVWKCLGVKGIDILWDLVQSLCEQEKIQMYQFIKRSETHKIVVVTGGLN